MKETNNPYKSENVFENPNDLDWREMALCAETDPEIFFPDKGGSTKEAKSICQKCDVRVDCLENSFKPGNDDLGIRGGLSFRERRSLKIQLQSNSKS